MLFFSLLNLVILALGLCVIGMTIYALFLGIKIMRWYIRRNEIL